jgi:hypothetical protein
MTTTDRSILDLLRGVRLELDSAGDVDTVSLARPRAKLAWIASLIPDQRPAPRQLLNLAAEVASVIGIDDSAVEPDQLRLVATRTAVSAVVEYLEDPAATSNEGVLAAAGQLLLRADGRNPSAWFRANVQWTAKSDDDSGEPEHLSLERLRTPRSLRATG